MRRGPWLVIATALTCGLFAPSAGAGPGTVRPAATGGRCDAHRGRALRGASGRLLIFVISTGSAKLGSQRLHYYACLRPSGVPIEVGVSARNYLEGAIVTALTVVGDDVIAYRQTNDAPETECGRGPIACNALAVQLSMRVVDVRRRTSCITGPLPRQVMRIALSTRRWSCARGPLLGARLDATEFPIAGVASFAQTVGLSSDLAAAPDGTVWVTQPGRNAIARFDPYTGQTTEYTSGLSRRGAPWGITTGPDGALWFTDSSPEGIMPATAIGRIDPTTGDIVEYRHESAYESPPGFPPRPEGNDFSASEPTGITAGPDGNLWVAESQATSIGRVTPSGMITQLGIPFTDVPIRQQFFFAQDIAAGPDGNLWLTTDGFGQIARLDPTTGQFTEYTAGLTQAEQPGAIAPGPDGGMWFTVTPAAGGSGPGAIGRIDPATGRITLYPLGAVGGSPDQIVAGPDGAMWFTFSDSWGIGRIDVATGHITVFFRGLSPQAQPDAIVAGREGTLWFTDDRGAIGRIDVAPPGG